jgi:hypothetical protein
VVWETDCTMALRMVDFCLQESLPYFVRFRGWSHADTATEQLRNRPEGPAVNEGLPTTAEYAEKRARQITTLNGAA